MFEGRIDFSGQKLADQLYQSVLVISAVVAFIAGYLSQSHIIMLEVFGAGILLTLLLVVPPWPMYNKNPLNWLPAVKKAK
ncbi:hypothetical protein K7432_003520 [Basidiobolus ranarum]|uniref:Signal peptidase complex subunit 1 n=1 Tax=Basidiobolus ranarum TaxID=34480 RepID=A0ABR2W620_9FUNG